MNCVRAAERRIGQDHQLHTFGQEKRVALLDELPMVEAPEAALGIDAAERRILLEVEANLSVEHGFCPDRVYDEAASAKRCHDAEEVANR